MTHRPHAVAPLLLALALVGACDDGTSSASTPGLLIDPASASLPVGSTLALGASVVGERPAGATITWSVVPDSLASVDTVIGDAATVRALRVGSARLFATLRAGGRPVATSSVELSLTRRVCPLQRFSITPAVLTVVVGGRGTLRVEEEPCGPATRFSFRSRDSTIASVDSTGVVTGRAVGVTTVLAHSVAEPDVSVAATVNVMPVQPMGTVPVDP